MMDKLKKIQELGADWYELIGKVHHKDRDCHFHISTYWSYGEGPKYRVEHFGYVADDYVIECATYDEAVDRLVLLLQRIIKGEIEHQKEMEKLEAEFNRQIEEQND